MSNKKTADKDYLFMTAMLRAREASMVGSERAERLLESPGFVDAAKMLTEWGYENMSAMDSAQVDACLSKRREAVFYELERLAPEKELIRAFRLKYDYHNAKVLVKAQGADVDGERLLSGAGSIDKDTLADAFNDADYRYIPQTLALAMQDAVGLLARTENPQLADFALDKAYFAEFLALAQALESSFLTDYVKTLIDSANLRAAVRTLRMGRDADFLKTALIPGGSVEPQRIAEGFSGSDGLVALFSSTALRTAAQLGQQISSGGSMTAFERQCDDDVTGFLEKARQMSFGPGPVAAYIAAFESELTAVRMILTGLLSGLSSAVIKERLRKSYV